MQNKGLRHCINIGVPWWRRRWDSNPRALSDNLISSQARYDHFDTSPDRNVFLGGFPPEKREKRERICRQGRARRPRRPATARWIHGAALQSPMPKQRHQTERNYYSRSGGQKQLKTCAKPGGIRKNSAGRAADGVLAQDLLLALEQVVGEELCLDVLKAQARDGVRKALAGDALVAEEQECLLQYVQDLLLGGEDLVERLALRHLLAPTPADADAVAVGARLQRLEGALADAAAAVVAGVRVDDQARVRQLRRADGAVLLHRAGLAGAALLGFKGRHALADDAEVVQVRLYAVVRAAAQGDLELVGQLHAVPALVEHLVDLLREGKGVVQAVLAGRALAGDHRAHLAARAARGEPFLGQIRADGRDVLVGHALDFDRQARGHGHFAIAELLRRLRDAAHVRVAQLAVAGDDAAVEVVGALAVQEAQGLDLLDLRGGQRAGGGRLLLAVQAGDVRFQHVRAEQHRVQTAEGLRKALGLDVVAVHGGERLCELGDQARVVRLDAVRLGELGLGVEDAQRGQAPRQRAADAAAAHAAAKAGEQGEIRFRQIQTIGLVRRAQEGFRAVAALLQIVLFDIVSQHRSRLLFVHSPFSMIAQNAAYVKYKLFDGSHRSLAMGLPAATGRRGPERRAGARR